MDRIVDAHTWPSDASVSLGTKPASNRYTSTSPLKEFMEYALMYSPHGSVPVRPRVLSFGATRGYANTNPATVRGYVAVYKAAQNSLYTPDPGLLPAKLSADKRGRWWPANLGSPLCNVSFAAAWTTRNFTDVTPVHVDLRACPALVSGQPVFIAIGAQSGNHFGLWSSSSGPVNTQDNGFGAFGEHGWRRCVVFYFDCVPVPQIAGGAVR
jgi:hypothetical protein